MKYCFSQRSGTQPAKAFYRKLSRAHAAQWRMLQPKADVFKAKNTDKRQTRLGLSAQPVGAMRNAPAFVQPVGGKRHAYCDGKASLKSGINRLGEAINMFRLG